MDICFYFGAQKLKLSLKILFCVVAILCIFLLSFEVERVLIMYIQFRSYIDPWTNLNSTSKVPLWQLVYILCAVSIFFDQNASFTYKCWNSCLNLANTLNWGTCVFFTCTDLFQLVWCQSFFSLFHSVHSLKLVL